MCQTQHSYFGDSNKRMVLSKRVVRMEDSIHMLSKVEYMSCASENAADPLENCHLTVKKLPKT